MLIVLPARVRSTRFSGKLLYPVPPQNEALVRRAVRDLQGMDLRVEIVVATDSGEIADAVSDLCPVYVDRIAYRNGTERVAAVAAFRGWRDSIVVNVQADMYGLAKEAILGAVAQLKDRNVGTAAVWPCLSEALENPHRVKVCEAGFFRINPGIPCGLHLGVYAFRSNTLREYARTAPHFREEEEGLEQLRLGNIGVHYFSGPVPTTIDTPADVVIA